MLVFLIFFVPKINETSHIALWQDIKALFPSDYNPFYAGFGNRDTDELSYKKIGIPKGKIFIINPKVYMLSLKFWDNCQNIQL